SRKHAGEYSKGYTKGWFVAEDGVLERPAVCGRSEKGRTGNSSCAALENNRPSLLLVRLVWFRLRLGFWFRLVRRGRLGCAQFACLRLRNQQHPRAAVQVHVLPCGSDHRTLRGVRGRRVKVQTVQAKHALAVRGELTGGVQTAD